MTRTTFTLPNTLRQRLTVVAKTQDKALAVPEKAQLKNTYTVLKKLDGIGRNGIRDASTTIDAMLYGDKGMWQSRNGR